MIRIGSGFDVHRFGGEGPCTLGGVKIPYEKGLIAHSDGDVVLHALCDALLGSLALGDIGHFYPDNDDRYLNIDSRVLLLDVYKKIEERGLNVNLDCVSIKATTTEKLGFTGRGEGIACSATVLVCKV